MRYTTIPAVLLVCVFAATGMASTNKVVGAGLRGASGGRIMGSVWDSTNHGVPNALVRLRNATTGRIQSAMQASETGQFLFVDVEGGNYVIEVVSETGTVRAVGQSFAVAPGETVATFVRLGTKTPWFAGFFSNAAASAVSSAAGLGVTALAPTQPTSPNQ